MRQRADVDAARQRRLADLQREKMAAALFREFRQQREFARARQLRRKVEVEAVGQRRIAGALEPHDGIDGLTARKALPVRRRRRRRRHIDEAALDLLRGELAVERSCRIPPPSRRSRVPRPSASLRRASEPVIGTRPRDGAFGESRDLLEMARGGRRILQPAQRIPAGMKLGVGLGARALARMARCHL